MKKIAIVLSGGGMGCSYSAGAMYALGKELNFRNPDILIAASGSAGTASYYASKQYDSIKKIWTCLLSTTKFINFFRPWRIININYLIDEVFKKQEPLNIDTIKHSQILYLISVTNTQTDEIEYFSNRDDLDVFELMRTTKSLPVFFHERFKVGRKYYADGISSSVYPKILKAKDLGAEKVIVINNEERQWLVEVWLFFYLRTKSKNFRIHFSRYRHLEEKYRDDKNVLFLKPTKKLGLGILTKNKNKLGKAFHQGVKDVMDNNELKEFLEIK